MRERRRRSAVFMAAILAMSLMPVLVGPVAAVDVGDDAAFRVAWEDAATTTITLTRDIDLSCAVEGVDPPTRSSANAIVVDGTSLRFTIHNPCPTDALIQSGSGLVTLRNLKLTGSSGSGNGLLAAGSDGPVAIENSDVTGHSIDGVRANGNATVSNSKIADNGDDGIETAPASDGTITVSGSSIFTNNGGAGIESDGAISVTGSNVFGNDNVGILTERDVPVTIINSTVSDNDDGGVLARAGLVTVSGSNISDNRRSGIKGDGDVSVTDTDILRNGDGLGTCDDGISADGISAEGDVSVTGGSSVSDNDDVGINADGAVTVADSTVAGNGAVGACEDQGIRSGTEVGVTNSIVRDNIGSGIWSGDDTSVTDSTVTDNGNDDHGIDARGDATVLRSTISGNGNQGGSGVVAVGNAMVTGSTITANSSFGIEATSVTIANSTVTDHLGGGIVASRSITATNATVTGNGVSFENHDPLDFDPTPRTLRLFGSVVLRGGISNCLDDVVEDQGFNFIDDASCGSIPANTADPQLGVLTPNGGPTRTRLPAETSPLVDAIPSASCTLTTDQRAVSRPQGSACDIGAVEVEAPAASINDVTVTEGNAGFVNAVFTVTLSRAATRAATINWATANATALTPADYESASGTITFVPGDVSESITVRVAGDVLDEPNETFVVNLSAASWAPLADAQGTGTIVDDDLPLVSPSPSPSSNPTAKPTLPPTNSIDGSSSTPAGQLLVVVLMALVAGLAATSLQMRLPRRRR